LSFDCAKQSEVLEAQEDKGIDTCTTCPTLCRWACPVAETEARETTSPHRLVVLAGLLKKEKASPEMVGAAPYHCSQCFACTDACLHKNDVPLLLSLARSRVYAAGVAPAAVKEVAAHFAVAGNPQGVSLEGPLKDAAAAAGASVQHEADTVYLPGCVTLAKRPETVSDFFRAASLQGVPRPALTAASSGCCGLPLLWAGDVDGFVLHARRFAEQLKGANRVVVEDPACAHALKVRYRELGVALAPEVSTSTDLLAAEILKSEPTIPPEAHGAEGGYAYHECCTLKRGLGQTEEPRRVLGRLAGDFLEIKNNGDCCGASGLLLEAVPETARAMAEATVDAFRQSGAWTLVGASPRCLAHLRSIDPGLPMESLTTLLAKS
jgi:Fe-S oxidoreductase